MTWKSAPPEWIVPLMPSPCTVPPRTGMTRRMPYPRSPATIGVPTLIDRLKTYFVASCGVVMMSSNHPHRQPSGNQREQDQQHETDQVGNHEWQHAFEYRRHA